MTSSTVVVKMPMRASRSPRTWRPLPQLPEFKAYAIAFVGYKYPEGWQKVCGV